MESQKKDDDGPFDQVFGWGEGVSRQAQVKFAAKYSAFLPDEGFWIDDEGFFDCDLKRGRYIDPTEIDPLFMFEFLELGDPDSDGLETRILEFANRFGGLNADESLRQSVGDWTVLAIQVNGFMRRFEWDSRSGPIEVEPDYFWETKVPPESQGVILDREHGICFPICGCANVATMEAWLAIHTGKRFTRCANPKCGKWMDYVPVGGKVDQLYCSGACRVSVFRQRKARAQQLHATGMTPAKIAKELGSTTEVVRGWLKK